MNPKTANQKRREERRRNNRKRGRPEKPLKIDDSPRNVARALFGLPPLKEPHRPSE